MALLKKIKASTLMETLVATVLIMVIFMLASMILNSMFFNTIKNNTRVISAQLNELQYLYINDKLSLPYYDDYEPWAISVESINQNNKQNIKFKAVQTATKKIIEINRDKE